MTPSKHPFAPSQELPVQALAMSSEAPDSDPEYFLSPTTFGEIRDVAMR